MQELQARVNDLLTATPSAIAAVGAPARRFSAFLPGDVEAALSLTEQFMRRAEEAPTPEDGLANVLQLAERQRTEADPALIQHALMMFIVHHPEGSRLEILPLEQRNPELLAAAASQSAILALTGESQLDWYREDSLANQHHEHWHVVYPTGGIPVPGNPSQRRVQDRQGELFFYMHQQMLARYDAERRGVGLAAVVPYDDYRMPIPDGYDPRMAGYSARADNTSLSDIPAFSYTVAGHEQLRNRVRTASTSATFTDGTSVNSSSLGATAESTVGVAAPFRGTNHHGMGHMLIAYSHDPSTASDPGVMADTATAIRDPVFYRWHRHVDDFSFQLQEEAASYNFAADAPKALIRKRLAATDPAHASPDIILAFVSDLQGADPAAFGESKFGGANWNKAFPSAAGLSTGTLRTHMLQRQRDGVTLDYLDHDEFVWFFRIENQLSTAADVTVRVFMAPILPDGDPEASPQHDRRRWIEMDKFQAHLKANQKAVVARRGADSSIIQKPALRPPGQRRQPGTNAATNYCTCGWPYNLLLPRGTADGMPFRLFVMLTDWQIDQVKSTSCGSTSYCGARNAKYPDSRAMGYPFDRKFAAGSTILDVAAHQDNMATRDIVIQLV